MKKSRFVLGLSMVLAVVGLVACGDDSASASNSGEELESSSSISKDENDVSSSSNSVVPSCGQNATWQDKCIETNFFIGDPCDAIGCKPTDCFENQNGWYALSCNGGSVMICDGTRWQYTNCAKPIIDPSSSSSNVASSSSATVSGSSAYDPAGANGKSCETEGEERYVGPFVYVCQDGQLSYLRGSMDYCDGGYLDCGTNNKADICESNEIQDSPCDVSEAYHKTSDDGVCDYICNGGVWQYTPPPM